MIRRFAQWVLRPWHEAAAIIADVQQHPAPANPPGPGTSPAPGQATSPQAAPVPAHGGIAYTLRVWNCGRLKVWQGHPRPRLVAHRNCDCVEHVDWDAELRRLTS